jgi:hypothetical protein
MVFNVLQHYAKRLRGQSGTFPGLTNVIHSRNHLNPPISVGYDTHGQFERAALGYFILSNPGPVQWLAIECGRLDVIIHARSGGIFGVAVHDNRERAALVIFGV